MSYLRQIVASDVTATGSIAGASIIDDVPPQSVRVVINVRGSFVDGSKLVVLLVECSVDAAEAVNILAHAAIVGEPPIVDPLLGVTRILEIKTSSPRLQVQYISTGPTGIPGGSVEHVSIALVGAHGPEAPSP